MASDVFRIVGTTQGGSFHVERVVAEGGFSIVYRALHGAFRAPVALKCLKVPDDLSPSQRSAYLERFREEAELLFRLSARIQEVVRPLHVDTLTLKDKRFVPFLAMEWLEGESLSDVISRRAKEGAAPMGLVKLVKLLAPVAKAIARAHHFPGPTGRIAIVHCDLKPENVFIAKIDGAEQARILDYGIAMAMRSAGRKVTRPRPEDRTESEFFTPGYAAPEQWSPRRFGAAGPKTDVWGLAITLVEAITGCSPLGDKSEDQMKAAALDERKRPTPRAHGATVSDEVESAFARALAVQPKERTADIETFWNDLEVALALPPTFSRRDDRADPDSPSWGNTPPDVMPASRDVPSPPAGPAVVSPRAGQPPPPPPAPSRAGAAVPLAKVPLKKQAAPPPPPRPKPPVPGQADAARRLAPPPEAADALGAAPVRPQAAPVKAPPGLALEEPFAFDGELGDPALAPAPPNIGPLGKPAQDEDLEADLSPASASPLSLEADIPSAPPEAMLGNELELPLEPSLRSPPSREAAVAPIARFAEATPPARERLSAPVEEASLARPKAAPAKPAQAKTPQQEMDEISFGEEPLPPKARTPEAAPPDLEPAPVSRKAAPPRERPAPAPRAAAPSAPELGDSGRSSLTFELAKGHQPSSPPLKGAPMPARRPISVRPEPTTPPPSLRTPAKLMGAGLGVIFADLVLAEVLPAVREIGSLPKFGGVGIFVVGLILLFWRLFDR